MNAARGAGSETKVAILIVVLLVGAHALWQAWIAAAAPYPARYDYDEGVYAESAVAAASGARLYSAVFLSQPPLLVGVLARAFGAFGSSLATARGVVIAFSVLWLAALAAAAARGTRPRAAVWALGIAVTAPAFVEAAHTVQMEAPSEALAALAVALGVMAAQHSGTSRGQRAAHAALWGLVGAAAGLAVMTKLTAVTCVAPLAAAAAAGDGTARRRNLVARAAVAAIGAVTAMAATVLWTGTPPGEMWMQAVVFHGAVARATMLDPARSASFLAGFAAANWLLAALGLVALGNFLRPHPAGGPPAEPGAPRVALRTAAAHRLAAAWLGADLLLLFLLRPAWPHHLGILVSPLALLAALGVESVVSTGGDSRPGVSAAPPALCTRVAAALLVVVWIAALAGTAAALRPASSALLRDAVVRTREAVPAGGLVIADDPIVPLLAGRAVPAAFCDTSETRLRAGGLSPDALIAALGDGRVRAVLLWRGTFRRMLPGFVDVAAQRFPRRWDADATRELLTR